MFVYQPTGTMNNTFHAACNAAFCPCCLAGDIAQVLRVLMSNTNAPCLRFGFCVQHSVGDYTVDCGVCCCLCLFLMPTWCCFWSSTRRKVISKLMNQNFCKHPLITMRNGLQLRERLNIPGNSCGDCALHTLCCCCALVQETKELAYYGGDIRGQMTVMGVGPTLGGASQAPSQQQMTMAAPVSLPPRPSPAPSQPPQPPQPSTTGGGPQMIVMMGTPHNVQPRPQLAQQQQQQPPLQQQQQRATQITAAAQHAVNATVADVPPLPAGYRQQELAYQPHLITDHTDAASMSTVGTGGGDDAVAGSYRQLHMQSQPQMPVPLSTGGHPAPHFSSMPLQAGAGYLEDSSFNQPQGRSSTPRAQPQWQQVGPPQPQLAQPPRAPNDLLGPQQPQPSMMQPQQLSSRRPSQPYMQPQQHQQQSPQPVMTQQPLGAPYQGISTGPMMMQPTPLTDFQSQTGKYPSPRGLLPPASAPIRTPTAATASGASSIGRELNGPVTISSTPSLTTVTGVVNIAERSYAASSDSNALNARGEDPTGGGDGADAALYSKSGSGTAQGRRGSRSSARNNRRDDDSNDLTRSFSLSVNDSKGYHGRNNMCGLKCSLLDYYHSFPLLVPYRTTVRH
jgi:Cys-rich protein (TIGR01571 family)